MVEECNASRDTICKRGNVTHSIQASKTDPTGKAIVNSAFKSRNNLQGREYSHMKHAKMLVDIWNSITKKNS